MPRRNTIRRATKNIKQLHRNDYLMHKEQTRVLVHELVHTYMQICVERQIDIPPYKQISIKHTVTRWGSCSSIGNLNFSYRLSTIAPELAEYVVVHELCHLREFNHSSKFWDLVELLLPDYKKRKSDLMAISLRK